MRQIPKFVFGTLESTAARMVWWASPSRGNSGNPKTSVLCLPALNQLLNVHLICYLLSSAFRGSSISKRHWPQKVAGGHLIPPHVCRSTTTSGTMEHRHCRREVSLASRWRQDPWQWRTAFKLSWRCSNRTKRLSWGSSGKLWRVLNKAQSSIALVLLSWLSCSPYVSQAAAIDADQSLRVHESESTLNNSVKSDPEWNRGLSDWWSHKGDPYLIKLCKAAFLVIRAAGLA